MKVDALVDFFIHRDYFDDIRQLRRARLLVRGCLLTSLFSTSYLWLSIFFGYDKGVYLMTFNVIGFLILPLLAKTRMPITWLGNVYVFFGAFAIIILTYFSGGVWSAIYPWIVSIPVLALLVVNKLSGAVWGAISLGFMVFFGISAYNGVEFPVEYNEDMRTLWYVSILPGLLLIILFIGFVFESVQTRALKELERKNEILESQKTTISNQSTSLEQLIEEKEYIIRIMAHDLRNPLASIEGFAGLMTHKDYEDQREEFIDMVKQAASNALHLIKRVLEMDTAEQKGLKINFEEVDIVFILSELVRSMKEMARKKQIMLNLSAEEKRHFIQSEKIYLTQIFENLLSNAIKFSDKGKKVDVVVADDRSCVRVKVMDEGPGIKEDEKDKLFQKFSKLSARPTGEESSTGLGLSLVKRYVDLIGGRIWYEGKEGEGSVFVVELPLMDAQAS